MRRISEPSGEGVATAFIAIATPSSPPVSLFDSPNENSITTHKCLMAKASNKVTPHTKTIIPTNPSLIDCVRDNEEAKEEENEFDKFMGKLKGETKKHFVALLEQLGEDNAHIESQEETITKMEGHSRDYADEIADLSLALAEEQGLIVALEESQNLDLAKLKKDHDHAQVLAKVLKSQNDELEVDHARLKEEFEILDKAHKALKGAHATLKESHDQLQVKLTKEITTCPPFVLIDKARATNPCCEHAHLVEGNTKLKEQLEKGLVSCIQGEKNLNELLSNQKELWLWKHLDLHPSQRRRRRRRARPSKLSHSKIYL